MHVMKLHIFYFEKNKNSKTKMGNKIDRVSKHTCRLYLLKRARFTNWLFGPVFSQKSKKPIEVLQVIFSFIRTPIFFRYAKLSCPKVIKGSILASDVWMSDPNLMFFADFRIFKLMVKYEDTSATERYFVKLLSVVRYTICKRMVVWQECIRC